MTTLRKILFWLFTLIYLVVCPVTLLYTFGYMFNPADREIVQAGLVHINTIPPNAYIYLNRSRYTQRTPAEIREILPGDYTLSVKKRNYKTWSYNITVKPGEANVYDDIILIPEKISPARLSNEKIQGIIPFYGLEKLLLNKNNRTDKLAVLDINTLEETNIFGPDYNGEILSIFTEEESENLVISARLERKIKYLHIRIDNNEFIINDITKYFIKKPYLIKWDKNDPSQLFAVYKDYVNRLDMDTGALYPNFITDIKGFGISDKRIYCLSRDNDILFFNYVDNEDKEILFSYKDFSKVPFGKTIFYRIYPKQDGSLVLMGSNRNLIVKTSTLDFLRKKINGFQLYIPENRFIFWTKRKIDIFLGEEKQCREIYRNGLDINQCFFIYNGTHIIFRDGSKVYLLKPVPEDIYEAEQLVEVKKDSAIYYSDKTGCLYYIDPSSYLNEIRLHQI